MRALQEPLTNHKYTVVQLQRKNTIMMTSPRDKKNKETPYKMPSVLFPTRRFAISSRGGGSNPSFAGQDDDADSVQWHGMTPLELIASLAGATELKEAADGMSVEPIRVNGTKLSSKTPSIPPLVKKRDNGHKKQDVNDLTTLTESHHDLPPLPPWDPSYLLTNDVYALDSVERIQALAHTLETMPHYVHVKGSYERIQDHLAGTSEWIHTTYCGQLTAETAAEKFQLLCNLYGETIHKMEALVDMTANLGGPEEEAKMASKPLVKRDFAEYMVQWLKGNWTNPYPDEDGLETMARDCGVTTSVVNNWLINARTRRWRPAIVRAYELKRPADLLLEDSINIFDGNPVREMGFEASQIEAPSNKRRKYN
jgi:hypothetical protein